MAKAIVLGILCLIAGSLHSEDPTEIDLGGPRRVKASIIDADESYKVEVSFSPVRAFDPSMNKRLSNEKARRYAVEALLRYLDVNQVSIRNSETLKVGTKNDRFYTQVSFLKDGLETSNEAHKSGNKKVIRGKASSTIKAKSDFEETIAIVVEANQGDIPEFATDLKSFYQSVSDAEDTALSRLLAINKEIKSDRWLLSIERDELLKKVQEEEGKYLDLLRKRVERVEKDNPNVDK
jgi:hypothetical protein